ncbi:MAG: FIST C-terminal domain-containing protein [Treponema sp.]|nr:FIST C-terminal domain-containing protein [Treponema sp.]
MIQVFSAHTSEIDDVEAAVSEILEQLNINRRLKYSAGIMYYYGDFAHTGVVQQISKNLPFPIVGGTTSNSAIRGSKEDITLTITVFTSDDVAFSAGISESLHNQPFMPLEKLYKQMLEEKPHGAGKKPAMFYIVVPHFYEITGDDYLAALDGLSGGVPVFGSVAFTHTVDFKDIKTFYNGVEYDNAMAVLAFWGDLEPQFFVSNIPEEQIINKQAVITDSYRNRVKRVNGIPVLEYLESIGLAKDGQLKGIGSFPLVLHLPDGSRLVRTIYGAEDGELLCSGAVPSGYPMGISFCDRDFVMESARKTAEKCKKWLESRNFSEPRSALVISCAARRWTLGSDVYAEVREIDTGLKDLPYHFIYTRGEFCPVHIQENRTTNYFFNFTLGICVL